MPKVLVDGAVIECMHGGQVKLTGGGKLTVSNSAVLTSGMEAGLAFGPAGPNLVAPCSFTLPNGSPSPCTTSSPSLPAGVSTRLSVGGQPALLETANGTTVNTPPATWSVAAAGQTKLESP